VIPAEMSGSAGASHGVIAIDVPIGSTASGSPGEIESSQAVLAGGRRDCFF
jgi:hypothetical protein